jgi:hypothetical protein
MEAITLQCILHLTNEGRELAKQGQSMVLKAEEGSMPNPCGICGE